jgi:hypothetical protein
VLTFSAVMCTFVNLEILAPVSIKSTVEPRLSNDSRTNRFPNIKPKQKTHRFPNRQTGNPVREMYGGGASVTSQPPLSAAFCSNLPCLFLIFSSVQIK